MKDFYTHEQNKKSSLINKKYSSLSEIKIDHYEFIQKLLLKETGIYIPLTKKSLTLARLTKRLKANSLTNWTDYIECLQNNKDNELTYFINALSSPNSNFFREKEHFNYLEYEYFPYITALNILTPNLLVAGCAAGEEVYSLKITIEEFKRKSNKPNFRPTITACDINTEALANAVSATYKAAPLERDVEFELLNRYFKPNLTTEKFTYTFKKEFMKDIVFINCNLNKLTNTDNEKYDCIFLRNVLIYFEEKEIINLTNQMFEKLKNNALLVLGSNEEIIRMRWKLKQLATAIYQKNV